MAQKKREPGFDAMIRLFLQKSDIATRRDFNRLAPKIEELQ